MSGVLPLAGTYHEQALPPAATEVELSRDTWLGPAGARLRGYLNNRWDFAPGAVEPCVQEPDRASHIVRFRQAIGSRLHLDFAAQEHLVGHFFAPQTAAVAAR